MAETSGLLNRRTGFTRTEGSNPSVSASGQVIVKTRLSPWHRSRQTASKWRRIRLAKSKLRGPTLLHRPPSPHPPNYPPKVPGRGSSNLEGRHRGCMNVGAENDSLPLRLVNVTIRPDPDKDPDTGEQHNFEVDALQLKGRPTVGRGIRSMTSLRVSKSAPV